MESKSINSFYVANYAAIGIIISLIGAIAYHPFFFGDELLPWLMVQSHFGSFIDAFNEYCRYKPRLIFNAVWIFIADKGFSRIVPALIMLTCQAFIANVIFWLSYQISKSKILSWFVVAAFLSSRFGIMLWYDYLSGIIETLSFAFFLAGLLFLWGMEQRNPTKIFICMGFLCCSVFVHERYMIPVLAVGACLVFWCKDNKPLQIKVALLTLLPGILFFVATKSIGSLPILTGTAGQRIEFGNETFVAFISYLGNVFFQTNYGHDWFVGTINWGSLFGRIISVVTGLSFLCIYFYGIERKHLTVKYNIFYISVVVAIFSLILVASLPGLARHEARWMYPVFSLFLIASIKILSSKVRFFFLGFVIAINSFYFFSGSLNSVYNIVASRTAERIANALSSITPVGSLGIIVGEGSSPWVIGGNSIAKLNPDNGNVFSYANSLNFQIDPSYIDNKTIKDGYDFVLLKLAEDYKHIPIFTEISVDAARFLLAPNSDIYPSPNMRIIGKYDLWNNWHLKSNMLIDGKLILSPGRDGFLELPANEVHQKILVYTAKSIDLKAYMRLQVNWHDKNDRFISTSIQVVPVSSHLDRYASLVSAPLGAVKALVYVTLHDGEKNDVELESVSIIDPKSF